KNALIRLFISPLPGRCPFFFPSKAVASSLYTTRTTSGSSVLNSFFAFPSYSSSPRFMFSDSSPQVWPARSLVQQAQPAEQGVHVFQMVPVVETVGDLLRREHLGYHLVRLHQRAEGALLLPGPHRQALHPGVGLFPLHSLVDEGEEDPLGINQAEGALHVPFHVFREHGQLFHDSRKAVE